MVGTPRRTGCETCRIRKKRCDEARPSCKACRISGWKCPGYSKRWKFVSQNTHLSTIYASKKHLFDDASADEEGVLILEPFHKIFRDTNFALYETYHYPEYSYNVGIMNINLSMTKQERIGYLLASLIENQTTCIGFPTITSSSYFSFISCRIGWNEALDTATECFCRIWQEYLTKFLDPLTPSKDRSYSKEVMILYGKSLRALNKCLSEEYGRRHDSETICASIVLQFCELALNSADKSRWYQLIKGTSVLIQNCGPSRFIQPFERAMLESQWSFFISNALPQSPSSQDKALSNYLARPEWRQLLSPFSSSTERALTVAQPHPPPRLPPDPPCLRFAVFDFFVDIPKIFHLGFELLCPNTCRQTDREIIDEACKQAYDLRNIIEQWYKLNLLPLVARSPSPELERQARALGLERDASQHRYRTFQIAILDCILNTIITCLDHLLISLYSTYSVTYYPCLDDGNYQSSNSVSACCLRHKKHCDISQNALAYVQAHSPFAVKPLRYSISRLWKYKESICNLGASE